MGKTVQETGTVWAVDMQTCFGIERTLTAWVASGHVCKLPVQTPAKLSPLLPATNMNNILKCFYAEQLCPLEVAQVLGTAFLWQQALRKCHSCAQQLADAQTASLQTAVGITRLCMLHSIGISYDRGLATKALQWVRTHLTPATEADRSNFHQVAAWTGI